MDVGRPHPHLPYEQPRRATRAYSYHNYLIRRIVSYAHSLEREHQVATRRSGLFLLLPKNSKKLLHAIFRLLYSRLRLTRFGADSITCGADN
jgi:hypothetical protein